MPPNPFKPLKLITLGLSILLLAPIGVVFWRMATHRPWSEAEQRERLKEVLREEASQVGITNADGSVVSGVVFEAQESIGFSDRTHSWLSFYPRRWVGVVGLVAVTAILACLVVSLFVPRGEVLTSPPL